MRPSVSLLMIICNEEKNLEPCLRPMRGLVDEIIVVDTGSSDQSRQVAGRLGARVIEFPWVDDFAAARNEGLAHAKGDFVLWMDADDRLDSENTEKLAQVLETLAAEPADVYMVPVLSPVPDATSPGRWVSHPRLFRRGAGLRWSRRVHEELAPEVPAEPLKICWTDLVIRHVGYEDPVRRRRKLNRDMRLLQLEYAVNPDDPLTLFYLGWGHLELGHLRQAERFLRRALGRNPHIRKLYALLGQTLSAANKKGDALQVCNEGLTDFPDDPEMLFLRGTLLGESGDLVAAEQTLLHLIHLPPRPYHQLGVEEGLANEKARFMLGLLYQQVGRFEEAELQFRSALRHNPRSPQAWVGLAQLYLLTGSWSLLAHALAELKQCPSGDLFGTVIEARWMMAQKRFPRARQLLEGLIARQPQMLWPRLALSDLAMQGGVDHAGAIEIHRELLQIDPRNAAARERLEMLLRRPQPVSNVRRAREPVDGRQPAQVGWSTIIATR